MKKEIIINRNTFDKFVKYISENERSWSESKEENSSHLWMYHYYKMTLNSIEKDSHQRLINNLIVCTTIQDHGDIFKRMLDMLSEDETVKTYIKDNFDRLVDDCTKNPVDYI